MAKQQTAQNESADPSEVGIGWVKMGLNWIIAGASMAVIAGFGYWAFSLGARNPNDVPIIRAMEGPARVLAKKPGGEQASHQGLAVNSVQADGGVAAPSDTVSLAPAPEPLSEEDLANNTLVAVLEQPKPQQVPVDILPDEIAKLIEQDQTVPASVEQIPAPRVLSGTKFSPNKSLRPTRRPNGLSLQLAEVRPTSAMPQAVEAVETVALGTRLIQLGAYDSTALAEQEWVKLFAKHGDLLEGKKRFVQPAESGGRKFFRLRAAGFATKDESRNLCSALLARGTPCIPVTAR